MSQRHLGVPFSRFFFFYLFTGLLCGRRSSSPWRSFFGNSRELTPPGANDANVSIVS